MEGNPQILVVCGPSGSGKSTFLTRFISEYPNKFRFSVSHTTRKPRQNEKCGDHYYFSTVENVEKMINDGKFLEWVTYSGEIYGTSLQSIEDIQKEGKICLLDINIEGVENLKKYNFNPILIFIQPPNLEELEKRLRNRATETEENLKKRLETAIVEINYGNTKGNFDHVIVNDDLELSYSSFKILIKEELEKRGLQL